MSLVFGRAAADDFDIFSDSPLRAGEFPAILESEKAHIISRGWRESFYGAAFRPGYECSDSQQVLSGRFFHARNEEGAITMTTILRGNIIHAPAFGALETIPQG